MEKVIKFKDGDVVITPEEFPHVWALMSDSPRKHPPVFLKREELPKRKDPLSGRFVSELLDKVN
jgi:hypothetical protein